MKRKVLDIKKNILRELKKNNELSLKTLEIKIKSGSQTILNQIEELKFFKTIEIIRYNKNKFTGRPYTAVRITNFGRDLV